MIAFDEVVRPELFRLVPLGEQRMREALSMAPTVRERFWWWSSGWDVPASALDDLSSAAHLIARFPEARDELDRLVQSQRFLDGSISRSAPVGAVVISLHAWLQRRQPTQESADELPLAMGFSAGEHLLIDEEDYQLSFKAPDELVLDIVADRRGNQLPTLELDRRVLTGELVPDCEERYVFRLDAQAKTATRATLRLPFARGDLKVDLLG